MNEKKQFSSPFYFHFAVLYSQPGVVRSEGGPRWAGDQWRLTSWQDTSSRPVEAAWIPAQAQEELFGVLLCSARRCRNTSTSPKIQPVMRPNTGREKDEVLLFLHPDQLRISCQHLIFSPLSFFFFLVLIMYLKFLLILSYTLDLMLKRISLYTQSVRKCWTKSNVLAQFL